MKRLTPLRLEMIINYLSRMNEYCIGKIILILLIYVQLSSSHHSKQISVMSSEKFLRRSFHLYAAFTTQVDAAYAVFGGRLESKAMYVAIEVAGITVRDSFRDLVHNDSENTIWDTSIGILNGTVFDLATNAAKDAVRVAS